MISLHDVFPRPRTITTTAEDEAGTISRHLTEYLCFSYRRDILKHFQYQLNFYPQVRKQFSCPEGAYKYSDKGSLATHQINALRSNISVSKM